MELYPISVWKNDTPTARFTEESEAIRYATTLLDAKEYISSIEVKNADNKVIWSDKD